MYLTDTVGRHIDLSTAAQMIKAGGIGRYQLSTITNSAALRSQQEAKRLALEAAKQLDMLQAEKRDLKREHDLKKLQVCATDCRAMGWAARLMRGVWCGMWHGTARMRPLVTERNYRNVTRRLNDRRESDDAVR